MINLESKINPEIKIVTIGDTFMPLSKTSTKIKKKNVQMKKTMPKLPGVNSHRHTQSVFMPDLNLVTTGDYYRYQDAEFASTKPLPIIARKSMGSYDRFKLFSKNARKSGMAESQRASSVDLEIQSIPLRQEEIKLPELHNQSYNPKTTQV